MCAGAIGFAGLGAVVYGLSIPSIAQFMPQIAIRFETIASAFPNPVDIRGPAFEQDCLNLFRLWS